MAGFCSLLTPVSVVAVNQLLSPAHLVYVLMCIAYQKRGNIVSPVRKSSDTRYLSSAQAVHKCLLLR